MHSSDFKNKNNLILVQNTYGYDLIRLELQVLL